MLHELLPWLYLKHIPCKLDIFLEFLIIHYKNGPHILCVFVLLLYVQYLTYFMSYAQPLLNSLSPFSKACFLGYYCFSYTVHAIHFISILPASFSKMSSM